MDREMDMDREEAERYPCRYQLPVPNQRRRRADPDDDSSWRCGAQPGEHCRDPRTDRMLTHQAAHLVRLQDAGRVRAKASRSASTCPR